MGMLDGIMGQMGGLDLAGLGARVGLSPDQVQAALAALGQAHGEPGDTAATAAGRTGLPVAVLRQLVEHVGGEQVLARLGPLLAGGGLGKLGGLFG